ncbi:MAG: signal peptidase I [Thermoleophilia bacterium]|nr:signal peptidase I [Thermoleophilia bacterium]MDH4339319.1 signal peptidase I [Thermoleophilia bacterium]MDH5280114.1 signal peptidase I [Thermoleophilia bacterium]
MSETDDQRDHIAGTTPGVEDGKQDNAWRMPTQQYEPPPPAPPFSWPPPPPAGSSLESEHHEFHHPLDRVTGRLPRRLRIAVDWVVTIVGAVVIVLAIKAFVVNPYRIPSSSMEATLHCARPAPGCESRFSDRVLANRFIYHVQDPARGDVVVFETPPAAKAKCGAGGTFVKRIVGLPGETVQMRLRRGAAFVYINGRRLDEPYIEHDRRDIGPEEKFKVPLGHYFVMGDNRSQSCDSRVWGSVPEDNLIGKVFMTYWPPQRISFR